MVAILSRTGSLLPKIGFPLAALLLQLQFSPTATAQVSGYDFRSSRGTYTPITGGTVLIAGAGLDNQVYPVQLSSPFWFNGQTYSTMHVSCNGYITLGSAPASTNYLPLSSNAGYAGAISPFGTNIWGYNSANANLRWEQIGTEVVVQWSNMRRLVPATSEQFSFQARLNLNNSVIKFVYDGVIGLELAQTHYPQVGLRGPDNSFPANVNNRMVDGTCWWGSSYKGTSNADKCRFTRKIPARSPAAGLTYTYGWNTGMELELTTDNNGGSTSWMILQAGNNNPVCSGTGYSSNTTYRLPCLATAGQYSLVVTDAEGDGMCCLQGTGGYILRNVFGDRILDNEADGQFTLNSTVALPFDIPLGHDHLIDSLCPKENYFTGDDVQAEPDPDVQAQFGTSNQTDDGYQFWFYDPDGGYSRRLFVAHSANNYFFPSGPDRCSFFRLGYITSNPLPLNKLLNLKVRSRVNGVNRPWGSACRLRIDLPDLCPVVKLLDDPAEPHKSCGLTGVLLNGSRFLWATFIPTAHKYKFEFTRTGYTRQITSISSTLLLTIWGTNPLQYGNKTYQVRVTTSYDNGATWCPFGPACSITTAASAPGTQERSMETQADPIVGTSAEVWPNPCSDGTLNISIHGLPETSEKIEVALVDAFGKQVLHGQFAFADRQTPIVLDLDNSIAKGIYFLSLTAGDKQTVERVVIDR